MVDLEIKVVFLDIIVKEGVIVFKSDAKGDKRFVIDGSHNIFKKHNV
jgi:formylmethanofuran dehydrogenase subunit A